MRLNIYQEELTTDVELVTKEDVTGADGSPVTFHGVRIYLEGTDRLHRTPDDDDRSAITFWFQGNSVYEALLTVGLERAAKLMANLRDKKPHPAMAMHPSAASNDGKLPPPEAA